MLINKAELSFQDCHLFDSNIPRTPFSITDVLPIVAVYSFYIYMGFKLSHLT